MIRGGFRWHWLYRGYLALVALLLLVFWIEHLNHRIGKHMGFFFILIVMTVFFFLGAVRPVASAGDPVMGHSIRWACILMLHIMLLLQLF